MKHIIPFSHEPFPFLSLLLSRCHFLSVIPSVSVFSVCSLSVSFPLPLSLSSLYFCVVLPVAPSVPPSHTSFFTTSRPFYLTLCGL